MSLSNRGKAILISLALVVGAVLLLFSQSLPLPQPTAGKEPSVTAVPSPQGTPYLDYTQYASQQPSPVAFDASDLFGLLWKTALVIAALYLSLRGLRWLQSRNLQSSPVPISVLASTPLEPGKRLVVVNVAGRILVLATAGSGVTLLTELSAKQTNDGPTFDQLLRERAGTGSASIEVPKP